MKYVGKARVMSVKKFCEERSGIEILAKNEALAIGVFILARLSFVTFLILERKVSRHIRISKNLRPLFFQKKSGQKRNLHPDEFLGQILSSLAKIYKLVPILIGTQTCKFLNAHSLEFSDEIHRVLINTKH